MRPVHRWWKDEGFVEIGSVAKHQKHMQVHTILNSRKAYNHAKTTAERMQIEKRRVL